MQLNYSTMPASFREITRRQRVILLCVAAAMTVHFLVACGLWCCTIYIYVARPGPHGRYWDWLPQASAAAMLLALFAWSAWCAWRWQRRSLRLLLTGLALTIALITVERSFSLYQIGVRRAGVGEYSAYNNSFEVRGTRDRF